MFIVQVIVGFMCWFIVIGALMSMLAQHIEHLKSPEMRDQAKKRKEAKAKARLTPDAILQKRAATISGIVLVALYVAVAGVTQIIQIGA